MPTHPSHIANNQKQAPAVVAPHTDYTRMLTCLKIFGIALFIAALSYAVFRDKNMVLIVVGVSFVLLALFHTPFGLMGLFAFLSLENVFVFSPNFSYSKLIGIVVFVSLLLRIFRIKIVNNVPQNLMFLFCIWSWLSYLWCVEPKFTMSLLPTLTLQIGIFFIMLNVIRDKKSFFVVLSAFAIGAIIISFMLMFGGAVYVGVGVQELGRATLNEDYGNPVIIGRAIAVGFIVTCLILWKSSKLLRCIALTLMVLMFVALLVRTQSRLAVFVVVAAPVFAFILIGEKQKRIKRLLAGALIAGIAYYSYGYVLNSDLMTETGRERFTGAGFEDSGRLKVWVTGLRLIASRPLHGYGIGNSPFVREGKSRASGFAMHNNIIALAADLGLVGLTIMTLIYIVLYKQVYQITDPRLKWLGMAMLFYSVVSGIPAVTYSHKDFWYSMQVAALTVLLSRDEKRV